MKKIIYTTYVNIIFKLNALLKFFSTSQWISFSGIAQFEKSVFALLFKIDRLTTFKSVTSFLSSNSFVYTYPYFRDFFEFKKFYDACLPFLLRIRKSTGIYCISYMYKQLQSFHWLFMHSQLAASYVSSSQFYKIVFQP